MASLERPGVKVRREQTAATPQAIVPVLRPYAVGPCYEVLDFYVAGTTTRNSQAALTSPARIVGSVDVSTPTALRGLELKLSVNRGDTQSLTFPTNLSTSRLMLSLLNAGFTGVTFSLTDTGYLAIQTTGKGDSVSIEVKEATANGAIGIATGAIANGSGTYKNRRLGIAFGALPAPRGNISYLKFDSLEDEIRAAYSQSGALREFSRTSAVSRTGYRQEYGVRQADGSYLLSGFPCVNPPVDGGSWDFSKTWGLGADSMVMRKLVGENDNDGDLTSPKVKSPGAAASMYNVFHRRAYTLLNISADTGTDNGSVIFLTATNVVPGYVSNNATYLATSQAAKLTATATAVTSSKITIATPDFGGGTVSAGDKVVLGMNTADEETVTITYVSADGTYVNTTTIATTGGTPDIAVFSAGFNDIVVSGSGTVAAPWVMNQKFGAGTCVHTIVSTFNASTTVLPNSVAVLGASTTVGDAFNMTAYGADTLVIGAGSDTPMINVSNTTLGGGKSGGINIAAGASYYGSKGNNITMALTPSTSLAFVDDGGHAAANPADVKAQSITYVGPAGGATDRGKASLPVTLPLAGAAFTLTIKDSLDWPHPLAGLDGNAITFRAVSGSAESAVVNFEYTDNELVAANIVFTFDTSPQTHLSDVKTFLEADPVIGSWLKVTLVHADPTTTNMEAYAETAFSNGVNPSSVSEVLALTDASVTMTAYSGYHYDSDTPVSEGMTSMAATYLTGGWDPVNFKEMLLFPTSDYNHGVVVSGKDRSGGTGGVANLNLLLAVNGGEQMEVVFDDTDTTLDAVVDRINGEGGTGRFGAEVASIVDTSKFLKLSSINVTEAAGDNGRRGIDSSVEIIGGSAVEYLFANTSLGETADDYIGLYTGASVPVQEGDTLYNNDVSLGTIVGFTSQTLGGVTWPNSVLVLNQEWAYTAEYEGWFVKSNNIDFESDSSGDKIRPLPQMFVDTENQLMVLKDNVARNANGTPASSAAFGMYAQYRALRTDPEVARGINIGTEEDLENVSPLDSRNPLGLALQQMFIASGSAITVSGLALTPVVDRSGTQLSPAVSDDEPNGTLDSYIQAAGLLASRDVYAIAPLTHAKEVLDFFKEHVETMSDESHKSERIVVFCPTLPDRDYPTVVGSGTGELVDESNEAVQVDANTLNVVSAFSDIGLTGADLVDADALFEAGVYLEIASDSKHYLIKQVVGQEITVHTDASFWEDHEGNEDKFYAETPIGTMQVGGEAISILQRGELVGTTEAQAEAMGALASSYNSYRVRVVGPDSVELPIDGSATQVEGFYLAALAASQICRVPPATPLTSQTVPMLTNTDMPDGMSDYEMGIAAHGGYCLAIAENASVFWRDFVTTKISPVEDFEHSMVTPDDVAAKLFRQELRAYVGPLAIDRGYLNRIAIIADALCKKLVEYGIYKSCRIVSIEQDTTDPRQIILKIDRSVYYPSRSILVILV